MLPGDGLHPVRLLAWRRGWAEVEIDGTVLVVSEVGIAGASVAASLLVVDQAAGIDGVDGC